MGWINRGLLPLAAVALPMCSFGQAGTVTVDARSNIFGYGVGTPEPGGGGGGVVAPVIALAPGSLRSITFDASGMAGWGGALTNGPDGGTFSLSTNISALGPVSGYSGPLSGFLVGVFIEGGDISGLAAPAAAGYPDLASYSLASYSPPLRQVFFIGDGRTGTGSGAVQSFNIPDGAATLVLGIADAFSFNSVPGWYGDNVGSYEVGYQALPVPEPAPAALLALGMAVLAWRRRGR